MQDFMQPEFQPVPVMERQNTDKKKELWKCCICGTSDRNCLRFSITAILSGFVLLFSSAMLAFADLPCSEQNTMVGLMTLTLGYWLKSPLD